VVARRAAALEQLTGVSEKNVATELLLSPAADVRRAPPPLLCDRDLRRHLMRAAGQDSGVRTLPLTPMMR
jgi:hypothetical protein